MATHSSILAWRIPGIGEPGGLPSMGSHRVRHDWSDLAAAATDVGNLTSGSSAFSKSSLNFWEFSVHILLKTSLENFEHDFAGMWNECNYAVVCTFFGITLVRDWNGNWPATPASFGFSNTLSCLSSQELQTWGSLNLDYFPFQLCAWLAFLYLLL